MTAPAVFRRLTTGATGADTLALALYVTPGLPRRLKVLSTAVLTASLAAGGWAVAANLFNASYESALLACAAIGLLSVLEFRRRSSRLRTAGVLRIAEAGRAYWALHSSSDARKPPGSGATENEIPFEPRSWIHALGIVWIEGRAGGERVRLAFTRDCMSEAEWSALRRWTRWLDRGGGMGVPP